MDVEHRLSHGNNDPSPLRLDHREFGDQSLAAVYHELRLASARLVHSRLTWAASAERAEDRSGSGPGGRSRPPSPASSFQDPVRDADMAVAQEPTGSGRVKAFANLLKRVYRR